MGLLDQVVGGLLGSGGTASPMGGVLSNLLGGGQQAGSSVAGRGGIAGLVSMFEQAGLGHIIQSWIGNGANLPVSPQQMQSVFGQERVQSMADQAGMQPQDFLAQLSRHLPAAVDATTPEGKMPDQGTVWA